MAAELRPTEALTVANGSPDIVGASPQWADDSDSSYVVFTCSRTLLTSPPTDDIITTLPAFDAGATGVGDVWIRLKVAADASPDLLLLNVEITDTVTGDFWSFGNAASEGANWFRLEADGVIRVVTGGLTFGDAGELAAALAAGNCVLYVNTNYAGTLPPTGPPPSVVTIYEIGWGTADTEILVTRLHPRKDAHGPMGSAPRLVGNIPPERIVGGHM